MLFDDEKDFIEDNDELKISDDDSISWDEVLDDSNEDSSLTDDNNATPDIIDDEIASADTVPDTIDESLPEQADNVEDAVTVSTPELAVDPEGEINENDLEQLLKAQNAEYEQEMEENGFEEESPDQFDLDGQFETAAQDDMNFATQEGEFSTRRTPMKKTGSPAGLLIVLLFIICCAAGICYGLNYLKQMGASSIAKAPSVGNQTDNITSQDIDNQFDKSDNNARENANSGSEGDSNIPVVNEEETESLTPNDEEAAKAEEKKKVVAVKPTGRPNPFLPLQKYLNMDSQDSYIYEGSGLPKPPESYGMVDEETSKLMTIAVSGIMYDNASPSAIITYDKNDYFVKKGDLLDNFRVVGITKNTVSIQLGKNVYTAKIGEEFKITQDYINGSATYLPSNQGNTRQYYSVGKSPATVGRYTSENDVSVNGR